KFNILGFANTDATPRPLKMSPINSPYEERGAYLRVESRDKPIDADVNAIVVFEATTAKVEWNSQKLACPSKPMSMLLYKLCQLERQVQLIMLVYDADPRAIFTGLCCHYLRRKLHNTKQWIEEIKNSEFAKCIPILTKLMTINQFTITT
ncbi:hypothetical protein ROZALSC1DRAFT_21047, partial [Rozella allomycis CSF55]